jgi:hypothetical protein
LGGAVLAGFCSGFVLVFCGQQLLYCSLFVIMVPLVPIFVINTILLPFPKKTNVPPCTI